MDGAWLSKTDHIEPSDLPFVEVQENPNLAMILTKTGGHIGFLEGWLPTGGTWMNRVVDEFVRLVIFTDFLKEYQDVPASYYWSFLLFVSENVCIYMVYLFKS